MFLEKETPQRNIFKKHISGRLNNYRTYLFPVSLTEFFLVAVFDGESAAVFSCEFSELMLFSNLSLALPKSFLVPLNFRFLKSKLTIFVAFKQQGHQNNATERDETNLSLEASDRVVEVEDTDGCVESGLVSSPSSSVVS